MKRFRPHTNLGLLFASAALALTACGADNLSRIDGTLEAPEAREARVTVAPALDVAGLVDDDLSGRIIIDEIQINLSDLRLLGSNPRFPMGGFPLIATNRLLSSNDATLGEFPFPSNLLEDDLAVYARIENADALGGASVVIKARLFSVPPTANSLGLTSGGNEAPNPDGEPANEEAPNPDGEPANDQAPNPDGEPANEEAPNPDGEPAICNDPNIDCLIAEKPGRLTDSLEPRNQAVSFELRGHDIADLVIDFEPASRMNILLAIPASRWFTPEVVEKLESALEAIEHQPPSTDVGTDRRKTVVVNRDREQHQLNDGRTDHDSLRHDGEDEYSLVDEAAGNPDGLRKH